MIIPNLLLIAGTGTKSGKTSMACKIIDQLRDIEITAVKITPHFHETTEGLVSVSEKSGYSIYEETNSDTSKDTSRMLRSGASKVFFAKVWDDQLPDVFREIMDKIPEGSPVICESPALRNYVEPGLFIIITSKTINKHKDINHLKKLPHVMFQLEELMQTESLPVFFREGKWLYEGHNQETEA
jgi:hydroxymethylpyrimidine pyrophosphatase-like HAD family hydrolase